MARDPRLSVVRGIRGEMKPHPPPIETLVAFLDGMHELEKAQQIDDLYEVWFGTEDGWVRRHVIHTITSFNESVKSARRGLKRLKALEKK